MVSRFDDCLISPFYYFLNPKVVSVLYRGMYRYYCMYRATNKEKRRRTPAADRACRRKKKRRDDAMRHPPADAIIGAGDAIKNGKRRDRSTYYCPPIDLSPINKNMGNQCGFRGGLNIVHHDDCDRDDGRKNTEPKKIQILIRYCGA